MVTVTGAFEISEDGESLILKAQSIEVSRKPEEGYVYPCFQSENRMRAFWVLPGQPDGSYIE